MNKLQTRDGKFKIVQFADIQEIVWFSPDTERLLRAVLEKERPQLAVLTGDQIKGYGVSMLGNARQKAETVLRRIISIFEETNTPFTAVFGNHDEFREADKNFQWEIYKRSPMFVSGGKFLHDAGLFSLPVYGNDGQIQWNLYGFDSYVYDPARQKRANVPAAQQALYRAERERLYAETGRYVPSLVFQHIPVPEVYQLMRAVPKRTKGALRGAGQFSDVYYVLGDGVQPGGFMRENAAVLENTGEFDALCEKGEVRGLFFGHDHINSFVGNYRGIDLCYTQGCGFNCYGPGLQRGARVIELSEGAPGKYRTYTATYADLCGKKLQRPAVEIFYALAPPSISVALDRGKKLAAAAAVIGAAVAVGKKLRKS
ncbi:MAG: metallophosphoesterase family protein [Clostridia bacterium]|nr:metallophosphoesterase family protein [Clostridia bacterium]